VVARSRQTPSSDPRVNVVALALKWIGGQELTRAGRDREADLLAAGEVLWSNEDITAAAVEYRLRRRAIQHAPQALSRDEQAMLLVLARERDIADAPGADPPWELVPVLTDRRVGRVRDALIDKLGMFPAGHDRAAKRDRFRKTHENPLFEKLARHLVYAPVEPESLDDDIAPSSPYANGLPERFEAYRGLLLAQRRADAMMLRPAPPSPDRIEAWLVEFNSRRSDVRLVGSDEVNAHVKELVQVYNEIAADWDLSSDPDNYAGAQIAYLAHRDDVRAVAGRLEDAIRQEVDESRATQK
jgi:hypothetical protein